MVDISMEILASSVPFRNGYMARYRVKTWWAHVDVPPDVTYIKLPRLPMIQPFLIMTGKDTTIFVETWQDYRNATLGSGEEVLQHKTSFLGMTTCTVDEQLRTPNLNPSLQWLNVHDPIEDVSRGKLLVKVDAKFILSEEQSGSKNRASSPSRSVNRHSFHAGSQNESPIKMIQSPRSSLAPNFLFDYNNSPDTQHVSSRKSDTSVFSIRSTSSTRSQEQAVQTDLCLPVLPEMHKYTASLNSKLLSSKQNSRSTSEDVISSSSTNTAGTTILALRDPLKFAEEILTRNLSSKNNAIKPQSPPKRRTSEPVSHSNKLQGTVSTSAEFRRSCLVKQHIQQQESFRSPERKNSRNCDMDSLEDVIDMLNRDSVDRDSVFDSPTSIAKNAIQQQHPTSETTNVPKNSKPIYLDSSKPSHSHPRSSTGSAGPEKDTALIGKAGKIGALKREAVYSANQFRGQGRSSPVYNDKVRDDYNEDTQVYHQPGRFKEIHFDGARAKQQAMSILMTRTTAEATSQAPVVTRRRICAATFND